MRAFFFIMSSLSNDFLLDGSKMEKYLTLLLLDSCESDDESNIDFFEVTFLATGLEDLLTCLGD